ncbi:response regulator [Lyngbya sp. PCC 8106]|uniref:response regulator n=1 Tax=Lyngbya sp. (strain PCC 8106) TaxID=313612 RepID=UPI0000EA8938|nr:response regulator [Lyngbya sp. PCC 8106]EAW37253.1 Response regulator receiver domain protein (CheY) [Lyngbya sp. PCC 8106]
MKRRILLIDDEEDIRELLQMSLEMSSSWEILTAESGQEGIEMACTYQPDAIILDVIMPDMDGPTTFEQLQKNPETQNIPVILLTAKAKADEQPRYTNLGVKAVLSKLINPLNFAEQLAEILEWRSGV